MNYIDEAKEVNKEIVNDPGPQAVRKLVALNEFMLELVQSFIYYTMEMIVDHDTEDNQD